MITVTDIEGLCFNGPSAQQFEAAFSIGGSRTIPKLSQLKYQHCKILKDLNSRAHRANLYLCVEH